VMNKKSGPAPRSGCGNYTTVEIPIREKVLVGMFFLNERPIIILFGPSCPAVEV
jgi:hypothetical protein